MILISNDNSQFRLENKFFKTAARAGRVGWQTRLRFLLAVLASSNAKKYSFLSQEPSEREGAIKRNDRLIRLQSLHEDGLALEWMAADAGAVDSRGYVLIGNNRWVLRNISILGGGHFRYCGDLPFGLLWSSSFEHAQLLLGNDHTGPPKSKDARVTFFLQMGAV